MISESGSNYKSKTMLINESGLYSLILSSKLPQAKEFKRWVTLEVLGQIRKTGGCIPINGCELVLWFYSSIIFKHTPIQNEKKEMKNTLRLCGFVFENGNGFMK